MVDLRNVIVFATATQLYAVDIKWVREVCTLGFVTFVPMAPPGLCGLTLLHGQIVPIINLDAFAATPTEILPDVPAPPPLPCGKQGDGALLVEAEGGQLLALRVERIDRVATMPFANEHLIHPSGTSVLLLTPDALAGLVQRRFEAHGDPTQGGLGGGL